MKKISLILVILCLSSITLFAQDYIPDSLSSYTIILVRRHFTGWERTLGEIPPGFTYEERKDIYEEYLESIDAIAKLFESKKIEHKVAMGTISGGDYYLDHKMECIGDDWIGGSWICNGGLYFIHRKSEKEYAPLGLDKFYKRLKKELK